MVLLILEHITTNSFGMLRDFDFDGIFDIWSIAPEHWPSQKDGPSSNHWFSRTMLPSFSEGVSEGIHKFTPLVRDPFAFGAVSFLCTHQAARQDPWFFQFVAEVQSRLLLDVFDIAWKPHYKTESQPSHHVITSTNRWPPAVAKTKVQNLGLDHRLFRPGSISWARTGARFWRHGPFVTAGDLPEAWAWDDMISLFQSVRYVNDW